MAKKKSDEPEQEAAGMSKMEAVRKCLAEGVEKPQEAVAFIKERYGVEIPPQVFSSYKSQIRAKEAGGASGGGRSKAGSVDPLEAAKAVKELVDRFGADTVRGLVDLFEE